MCDISLVTDVLTDRQPFAEEASAVLNLCEQGKVDGYVPAIAAADIYYLIAKSTGSADSARAALSRLLHIVKVCSLTNTDVLAALSLGADDLDTSITAACAQSIGCECIVSRHKNRYEGLGMAVRTPGELLLQIS